MNKLRLSLDKLHVESFDTARTPSGEGTVHAHVGSNARCNSDISCLPDTCHWITCMDCVRSIGGCTADNTCGEVACITNWTYQMAMCQFSCDPSCTC